MTFPPELTQIEPLIKSIEDLKAFHKVASPRGSWLRTYLCIVCVFLSVGCAHRPQFVRVEEGDLEAYKQTALKAVNSKELWNHFKAKGSTVLNEQHTLADWPTAYWLEDNGKIVKVQLEIKESVRGHDGLVIVTISRSSGEVVDMTESWLP